MQWWLASVCLVYCMSTPGLTPCNGLSRPQVAETTRDVCFLHNELFFAAAQRKYVYIYDKRGLEVHCLREHTSPTALQFLPHHFLLASIGESGEQQWAAEASSTALSGPQA